MSNVICIYHGKCADGFTAAWAVRTALEDIEFYPGVYQEPPPDVTGRDVIIVDFSYKRPVLEEMVRVARSIVILDHHKTAAEDLAGFEAPPSGPYDPRNPPTGIFALFDMDRSGAGLAWDYFHSNALRRRLINYVEDRDLWRFDLRGSREVSAYIFSHDYSFENWDQIDAQLEGCLDHAINVGAAIERKHHKDVSELVGVCKRRLKIGGIEVWAASLPYTLTSDAGHLMAKGEPFAACYWDTPAGRVFSLRSTDEGADVSVIARQYGGGGHRNASGFKVPLSEIGQFELAS
jgi:oligoribonuclease NrnB/cAMP/cGMP phosphodiesterase (DHH superfamily)